MGQVPGKRAKRKSGY